MPPEVYFAALEALKAMYPPGVYEAALNVVFDEVLDPDLEWGGCERPDERRLPTDPRVVDCWICMCEYSVRAREIIEASEDLAGVPGAHGDEPEGGVQAEPQVPTVGTI